MNPLEQRLFDYLVIAGFASAAVVFLSLFFVTAPYGRHARSGWGPILRSTTGWILMEFPAVAVFAVCFMLGRPRAGVVWVFFALWELHYFQRTFVFPFRVRREGRRIPLGVVAMAVLFNVFNGYLNGRYLGVNPERYTAAWLTDPRFIMGVALFLAGFAINIHSDRQLFRLRAPGETGYKIPHGGLFRWVSCPNYFGELLEWMGWAIATWSLPGLVFAVWTAANLVPRAQAHHRWYRDRFDDYPPQRKAILPYVL